MDATDLQVQCHYFAGGRPALAFELNHLEEAVAAFGALLAGNYPDDPALAMRDVKLPLYGLAYSGFVKTLKLDLHAPTPQLTAAMVATVHPQGQLTEVIATYDVTLTQPIDVFLDYSERERVLRWAARTSPLANVAANFSASAETILKSLGVPDPVLDTYERKVESVIIWSTSSTFVQLVIDALPELDVAEMAPWLTLQHPLEFNFGGRYLIVTSQRARMTIGDCTPIDVEIEPDPKFPYAMPDPVDTSYSRAAVAVYLPKTRLVEFVSKSIMPAIMYDSGKRGGIIRWRVSGAFGLKAFSIDIAAGTQTGNPWSGDLTLRGTLSVSTAIALTGVARAWVDGPCGRQVGLASASVQGDGAFAADIALTLKIPGGPNAPGYGASVEAQLLVTRSELDPNINIQAVGWPIDDMIGEIGNHLVSREVRKLAGTVHNIGRWEIIGVPSWLIDIVHPGRPLAPMVESMEGVSSVIGVATSGD